MGADPHLAPAREEISSRPAPSAAEIARAPRARVLVVDDSPAFLDLLCDLVRRSERLELVGVADRGESAVQLAQELQPAVVVIDVNMPGLGGIEAARQIKTGARSATVVLISSTAPSDLPRLAHSIADVVFSKDELVPGLLDRLGSVSDS